MKKRIIIIIVAVVLILIGALLLLQTNRFAHYQSSIKFFFDRPQMEQTEVDRDDCLTIDVEGLLSGHIEYPSIRVDQSLLLVNSANPVAPEDEFDLVYYKDTDVLMNAAIIEDYSRLSTAVLEHTGDRLFVMSSYRSIQEQQDVYDEDPTYAAHPGHSEHHTGLALDVYVYMYAGHGFLQSEAGRFVQSNAHDYGFIIRYPRGKEEVTGIEYEPWHIRYVGYPHAEFITRSGIAFEEYIEMLETDEFYLYEGYMISRQAGPTLCVPNCLTDVKISSDHTGYYIITGRTEDDLCYN